jgi:c-di-GMP-binding flagellar brake protein YcgR
MDVEGQAILRRKGRIRMTETFDERRKYKRAELRVNAEYALLHFKPNVLLRDKLALKHKAQTVNISEGGLQLLNDSALEPGQIVRIAFRPKEEEKGINAFAKVKWAGYDGGIGKFRIGMEFYYLHDNDKKKIQELVS